MSTRAAITVKGFNYALDNGESLLSVKVGDELDHLNPHGGPFRVAANDGYEVTLEPITPHATPDRAAMEAEKIVREFTDVWVSGGNPERAARAIVMALHDAGLIEGDLPDDWAGRIVDLGKRDA